MSRSYHHGALAEAMVERALAVVRQNGVEQVSLRAIAADLEVSPSAAYNHFADKEGLLTAVAQCGFAALDERMARVLAAHPGDSDVAARSRFAGLGRAYISFAIAEPHLFRLIFGPLCARGPAPREQSGPYSKLAAALDDLEQRGLLIPGARDGLELIVWGATHGIASLIIEGYLPPEASEALVTTLDALVFRGPASV